MAGTRRDCPAFSPDKRIPLNTWISMYADTKIQAIFRKSTQRAKIGRKNNETNERIVDIQQLLNLGVQKHSQTRNTCDFLSIFIDVREKLLTSYKKSFRISINIQSICFGYACTCFCRENTCDTAARSPARLLAAFFLDSISFRVVFPKRISARHCHAGAKEKGCSFCCQPFVSLKKHSCLQEWRSIPIWMERRASI